MKNHLLVLVILGCIIPNNTFSQSPLQKAVYLGDTLKAKTLLEEGSDVNEHKGWACHPLMMAAGKEDKKMIELLLKYDAKSDTCSSKAFFGHEGLYGFNGGIFEFSEKRILYTPLYYIIKRNHLDILKLFYDQGYNLDEKMGGKQFTYPIIASSKFGRSEIMNFLIEKEVDISVKDNEGRNALVFSIGSNNLEITDILLKNSCPVNDTSNIGFTPLMYASVIPGINPEIIDLLIRNGADINYYNHSNLSALSLACLYNNRNEALLLMEYGAIGKDSETEMESNAKMNHFLGDYSLSKGDLTNSILFYNKAKHFFAETILLEEKEISSVNKLKASVFLTGVLFGLAQNALSSIEVNQLGQNVGMELSNSQKNSLTSQYSENYRRVYSPIYERNPAILKNYELPEGADLNQQKAYHNNKITQSKSCISLIDGIIACIEKGLSNLDLDSCIQSINIINE